MTPTLPTSPSAELPTRNPNGINLTALLRSLFGAHTEAPLEALEDVLSLSVTSDGEVHPAEVEALRSLAEALPGMQTDNVSRWVARLSRGAAEVRVRGPAEERVAAFAERMLEESAQAKAEVLTLAALVQYVDGELVPEEERFLEVLAQSLGMSLAEAQEVIDRVEGAVEKAAAQARGAKRC